MRSEISSAALTLKNLHQISSIFRIKIFPHGMEITDRMIEIVDEVFWCSHDLFYVHEVII